MNGICYWTLDTDVLEKMRLRGSLISICRLSARIRLAEKVNRPNPLKKYRAVVEKAAALGFKTVAYQILGIPGFRRLDDQNDPLSTARLPVLLGASPFYLTPASPIASHFDLPTGDDSLKRGFTAWPLKPRILIAEIFTRFSSRPNPEFPQGDKT